MEQSILDAIKASIFQGPLANIEDSLRTPILLSMAAVIVTIAAVGLYFIVRHKNKSIQDSGDHRSATKTDKTPNTLTPPPPPTDRSSHQDDISWSLRLKQGLQKTRNHLATNFSRLISGNKIDEAVLEEIHELLYRADVGPKTADHLTEVIRSNFARGQQPEWEEVKLCLQQAILEIFEKAYVPEKKIEGPRVILVVGVNGVGKTTSIGKLAAHFASDGKQVMLCAADTFRAAAIDQLKVWGERLNIPVIHQNQGSDPAAVAYDAVKAAVARNSDILLIDTAGRLHNKKDLMEELAKIRRVISKDLPTAPHDTWLVIDATTGQNAFQQIRAFNEVTDLNGVIVTKLDGTAKGGVIIGATQEFQLPVKFIGVGEKSSDLRKFEAKPFVDSII